MSVDEGLEGQAEGLCSASILHLNQAGLQCGEAGQGLTPAPSPALYTRANRECVSRYAHIQVCQCGQGLLISSGLPFLGPTP